MDWKAYMDNIGDITGSLAEAAPDVVRAFGQLSAAAKAEGPLDLKTKELVALAVAAALRCEPCIGFHARTLARLGADRAEVAAALGMQVMMQGGPGYMYAAKALEAFDQFSADRTAGKT